MRLITFSFLKNCKFRVNWITPIRKYSSIPQKEQRLDKISGEINLLEVLPSWKSDEEPELKAAVLQDMKVLPDFVTEAEETALMAEIEPVLKRMRYEYDHWDNAIEGFRETERGKWSPQNEVILERLRSLASNVGDPLPSIHILDLAAAGHIKPHIDAVRFCGDIIAGICLLSPAIMRLVHEEKTHLALDALLPRRGLYIMSGVARYKFTHAVLPGEQSEWRKEKVRRTRRVSVICRTQPKPQA